MTPTEVATAARDLYNAVGDTYFTDAQLYNWMWQGCHEFAKKAWLIERMYTTTTAAGTQSYTYPSNTIGIKRITVNGKKIKRITMREDDAITLSNQQVNAQGWPIYYYDFNYTIYLRPIPDAVYTMQIFSYNDAQAITATSTLEIPTLFHFDLVDYLLWRMFAKDKDTANMQLHAAIWAEHVKDAAAYKNKMKRSDSFATVQSEDTLPVTILGEA
jgi:hypothetical protein